jgi:hypothetical protein
MSSETLFERKDETSLQKWAISWREHVNFQWDPLCTRPTCLVGFFSIVLVHW